MKDKINLRIVLNTFISHTPTYTHIACIQFSEVFCLGPYCVIMRMDCAKPQKRISLKSCLQGSLAVFLTWDVLPFPTFARWTYFLLLPPLPGPLLPWSMLQGTRVVGWRNCGEHSLCLPSLIHVCNLCLLSSSGSRQLLSIFRTSSWCSPFLLPGSL